jgi:hypothetical protein
MLKITTCSLLMPDRRDDILAHVNHPNYRPVKPKVIAKKLGAEGDAAEAVRKAVKRLVKEGLLALGRVIWCTR